jgi:hypothetical protein
MNVCGGIQVAAKAWALKTTLYDSSNPVHEVSGAKTRLARLRGSCTCLVSRVCDMEKGGQVRDHIVSPSDFTGDAVLAVGRVRRCWRSCGRR